MPLAPKRYRPPGQRQRRSIAGRERHKLYDQREWRRASAAFLSANPWCADCEREGIMRGARVTDHKIPHKGDERLFWDMTNWQGLCIRHHNAKAARE